MKIYKNVSFPYIQFRVKNGKNCGAKIKKKLLASLANVEKWDFFRGFSNSVIFVFNSRNAPRGSKEDEES